MIKKLFVVLLLLVTVNGCYAADVTNVIAALQPEIVGGTNVVSMHPHYNDGWFSVANCGQATYSIYAYTYIGNCSMTGSGTCYHDGFYGTIEPGQIGMLNNNGSYLIYASYDHKLDYIDTEKVKDKFNQWWLLVFICAIIIAAFVIIIRRLLR